MVSPTLTKAATWKSLHMARYGYVTHEDPAPPVARSTADRLQTCGYPIGSVGWGEITVKPRSRQNPATFAWTATNSPTAVTCTLDGAPVSPCTSPISFSNLTKGTHTFAVTASNAAGSDTDRDSWTA